ncbi:alanine racemase [Jejudonia soesokkakensis]|uniref:Alanine racemase n=1 Tax=Jejudonia soesokkakensis TaxID=1323432 RepID=A0ABW2MRP2_9FLAO
MAKATETILEIDLNALAHNYNYITSKLNPKTKVLAVVKAFGYGSEAVEVAKELIKLNVSYFAVAYASEGEALRNAGIETPILVLHPLPENFDVIVNRCLEPSIYSEKMLNEFISFAEHKNQTNYPIHLKFNTGLNRLGFASKAVSDITHILASTESIKVRSVFSHLAASEDASEAAFTKQQLKEFAVLSEALSEILPYPFLKHTLNTSGIINFPEAQYDMVRTGIGLYGFGNDVQETANLKPVATLKTVISQIHTIAAGESVGYNRAFIAPQAMQTATLPIGHADGISRGYGNGKGWVSIHGQKAPIVGNVCMDMIMVDISKIECKEGDEVIVFGNAPTAEALSEVIHSIPYELLTAISQRVKRVVCRK